MFSVKDDSYNEVEQKSSEGYEVMLSAKDDSYYYYVLFLGHVNNVPILFRDAVKWEGIPSSGIAVGFDRSEATEQVVSQAITTASSETISKNQELNYGLTVGGEASAKGGFLGIAEVGWKASVSATVGGATTWGSESTRSRESTVETSISKSTGSTDSLSFTVTGDDPYGKYRYTLFGTTDVYVVIQIDQHKTYINDSYLSYCARPASYSWGVDYDPDFNGTFKRNVPGALLELPELDLSSFPTPTLLVTEVQIPAPAAPAAEPTGGGTYFDSVDVTLSCVNADAVIYYTTDGTTPTSSSTKYTGAIRITKTSTLKAIAIKSGSPASNVMTENYTIQTSRQNASYVYNFEISRNLGGTVVNEGGDNDVNSQSGRTTNWELDIKITPNGNNAVAYFTYKVREGQSNWTILKLTQEKIIPLNKSDVQINQPNSRYLSGSISGKNSSYVAVNSGLGAPVTALQVQVDGSGDDQNNIKARGTLIVSYSFQP
jgi:hypothetical protein